MLSFFLIFNLAKMLLISMFSFLFILSSANEKTNHTQWVTNPLFEYQEDNLWTFPDTNKNTLQADEKYSRSENGQTSTILLQQGSLIANAILVLSVLFIFGLHKIKTNKIKTRLTEKELALAAFEDKKTNDSDSIEKDERMKQLLEKQLQISKKIAMMNSASHKKDDHGLRILNEIMYGDPQNPFDWARFYQLLNEMYDNILVKLQEKYPRLTASEIQFCSLIQAEFHTGEIAFILDINPNTVRMKKVMLRKKLGITDGGDLVRFFNRFLENNRAS